MVLVSSVWSTTINSDLQGMDAEIARANRESIIANIAKETRERWDNRAGVNKPEMMTKAV